MADKKDPEAKIEFSSTKSLDAKRSSRKTKIAVIGVLALVLLLGALVSTTSFLVLKKPSPTRLADVNLEEGETLTYRVDQRIELQGAQVQKGMLVLVYTLREKTNIWARIHSNTDRLTPHIPQCSDVFDHG